MKSQISYINKEISWLSFNGRVLQEAENPSVPLMERLKFLSIFSSNMDEFYKVRVATLNRLAKLGKSAVKLIGEDPELILKKIREIAAEQQKKFDKAFHSLIKELGNAGINLINETQLNPDQEVYTKNLFHRTIRPKLFPIIVSDLKDFPDLRDGYLYLGVCLHFEDNSKVSYCLLEIPTDVLPRFVILPKVGRTHQVILLEDVIRRRLADIFSVFHLSKIESYVVKITRDAELDISADLSQSIVNKISKSLKQRKEGNAVRFLYEKGIPDDFLQFICKKLKIKNSDALIEGGRNHNIKDFMSFPILGRNSFHYKNEKPIPYPDFDNSPSLIEIIEKKDVLLHYPYHSFDYVIDLLREASIHPDVVSIKITLYRVAKNSSVVNALINAIRNGKRVLVCMELQARFDEEANIYWANKLKEEGAELVFGFPGLKIHGKTCLITMQNRNAKKKVGIIGTGNFNEVTSKLYGDHHLFTCKPQITNDISTFFSIINPKFIIPNFRHLVVSPYNTRNKIQKLIRREIKNAKKGGEAYIKIKLNNLTDYNTIKMLYQASKAGVKIQLAVRGMFSLVPQVKGLSENIEAIGIIDRYLEHSRIFVFANGGKPEVFITSSDLMPRNLDHRLEITTPIFDEKLKLELMEYFNLQFRDNQKARLLNDLNKNEIKIPEKGEKKIRFQWEIRKILNQASKEKFKINHN